MRLFIFTVSILFFSAMASLADPIIYNVPISAIPTEPGTGGQFDTGVGSAVSAEVYGTITPVYELSLLGLPAGSEVNFGTLVVYPYGEDDQYGDVRVFPAFYAINGVATFGPGGFSCGPYGVSCSNFPYPYTPPLTVQLIFPSDEDVQITYVNGSIDSQISPVPEPSTWAMLLIGFVAMGFAGASRRRLLIGTLPLPRSYFRRSR
jgi:hypothetical protein